MGDFDIDVVNSCCGSIEDNYYDIYFALHDRVQREFIEQMQDKWACEKAQDFFNNNFKERMESLIVNVNLLYKYIIGTIFDEADTWARNTGWEFYPGTFDTFNQYFDTSCIRNEINGVKGIDLQNTLDVVNVLKSIKADTEYYLKQTRNTVNSSRFIDYNKKSYIIDSINDVQTNMYNSIDGIFQDTDILFRKTVEDYKDTAGEIARSFNATN